MMIQQRGLLRTCMVCFLLIAGTWGAVCVGVFGLYDIAAPFPLVSSNHAVKWIIAMGLALTLLVLDAGSRSRARIQPAIPSITQSDVELVDPAGLAGSIAASSHELQTSLSAIIGLTSLLSANSLDDDQARQVNALRTSASHMFGLVSDVLDLSRLDAGDLSLVTQTIDLDGLLDQLHIIDTVGARGLLVRVVATRHPAVPRYLMADRQRLTQILLTIVAHAAESAAASIITIRVELALDKGENLLRFAFTAWEPGRDHADLADIFLPFGDLRADRYGASLGPAISERLVSLMGGDIHADRAAIGAHLILDLPLTAAPAQVATAMAARVHMPVVAAPRALKILVADDSTSGLHVMTTLLRRQGHHVVAVRDGADAIEAARETAFDLCLLDLQMDGIGGIDAACGIRALNAPNGTGAVYALSARIDAADRQACSLVSMDGCLVKPLLGAELTAVLDQVAGRRESIELTARAVQHVC